MMSLEVKPKELNLDDELSAGGTNIDSMFARISKDLEGNKL